jgi:hypothetical protein
MLTRQTINYGIYLIEPVQRIIFNIALLMNIGFMEAIKDTLPSGMLNMNEKNIYLNLLKNLTTHSDCFVFHDVDMIVSYF